MADYDSSLPIRSEADGSDERVLVKIQDGASPDGVGATAEVVNFKVSTRVHGNDSDDADKEILLSQEGHVQSNGDYDATSNKRPSSQGLIASDRDASPAETTMNKRPTAIAGDSDKVALDVAISDSSGNSFSEANPLPVYATEDPGTEVDDFDQTTDTASDATANHDYTVAGSTLMKKIKAWGSASGKARFELQVETGVGAGTYNTVMVKFNSTSNPNVEFEYRKTVATGVIVRMAKTNLDNQAQDLYSEISGIED